MAGRNVSTYVRDTKTPFFSMEDDIDDEEFLSRSKPYSSPSNNTTYGRQNISNGSLDLEQQRQRLIERRQEIENRTILSSERSIGLLRESEQVGIATAEELKKQREQLERTEKSLDNINTTLHFTQKNIEGIKSVFGSLKNYLTRKSDQQPVLDKTKTDSTSSSSKDNYYESSNNETSNISPSDHPGLRIRGLGNENVSSYKRTNKSVDQVLDDNLDEIATSITGLKGLALGLGAEILSQNDLIDKITTKSEDAEFNIKKQNKDMQNLLKK